MRFAAKSVGTVALMLLFTSVLLGNVLAQQGTPAPKKEPRVLLTHDVRNLLVKKGDLEHLLTWGRLVMGKGASIDPVDGGYLLVTATKQDQIALASFMEWKGERKRLHVEIESKTLILTTKQMIRLGIHREKILQNLDRVTTLLIQAKRLGGIRLRCQPPVAFVDHGKLALHESHRVPNPTLEVARLQKGEVGILFRERATVFLLRLHERNTIALPFPMMGNTVLLLTLNSTRDVPKVNRAP